MLQLISRLAPPWQAAVCAALVGDAFGVPHEFKTGADVPLKEELAMVMREDYPKSYPGVPYGTWSDDGSQLLALLYTLVKGNGHFDATLFGSQLLAWLHDARYQAGGAVFDCGIQTRLALNALEAGSPPPRSDSGCGNGSLMRVLPVAALPDTFGISRKEALQIAMEQSNLTHPQTTARICCALYVALAWRVQAGQRGLRDLLPEAAQTLVDENLLANHERDRLGVILDYGRTGLPNNSGYVVNSLWSALWAIDNSNSLSDVLRNVVCLGGDTDTVACIAGGLASLMFGWDDTARDWFKQLNVQWTPSQA